MRIRDVGKSLVSGDIPARWPRPLLVAPESPCDGARRYRPARSSLWTRRRSTRSQRRRRLRRSSPANPRPDYSSSSEYFSSNQRLPLLSFGRSVYWHGQMFPWHARRRCHRQGISTPRRNSLIAANG